MTLKTFRKFMESYRKFLESVILFVNDTVNQSCVVLSYLEIFIVSDKRFLIYSYIREVWTFVRNVRSELVFPRGYYCCHVILLILRT